MDKDSNTLASRLLLNVPFCEDEIYLSLHGCSIQIRSNSTKLIQKLKKYFAHTASVENDSTADIDIAAIESIPPNLPYTFKDWNREAGKVGRKDAYFDLDNGHGRLLQKVRTGMMFIQSSAHKIAIGACLENDNQVINFINSQYMTWLQHRNWLICHAAAVVANGHALALSGFSGGGKSTLMLHLLDYEELNYLTNDRLLISKQGNKVHATGIPKSPRINPGTVVNNAKLAPLFSEKETNRFLSMPVEQLWDLEEKYDVDIEAIYGKGRIAETSILRGFLVLNWQRTSKTSLTVKQIDLKLRQDLLAAIMKSPGPFFQYPDGRFLVDTESPDTHSYLDMLDKIPTYEATGAIDFPALVSICKEQLI